MKKIIIMSAALLVITPVLRAQHLKDVDVPVKVKEAFSKKYPGIKAEWEKEKIDFEAEFKLNKVESSAVFDAEGNFKELEQEIKSSELPPMVMSYCEQNFAGYKLSEAAKITEASGKIKYEAEMRKNKEHFDALFDDKGNFITKDEPVSKE